MRISKFKTILLVILVLFSLNSFSQKSGCQPKFDADFSADLMSRYVWRGLQFGGVSPAIQPSFSVSRWGFEFGAWASYSIGGENAQEELDLYLSYTFLKERFTFMITDYYFPLEYSNYNYFDYAANTTGHVYEAALTFNGTEKIPFTFLAAVNFFGADARKVNNDKNSVDFNKTLGLQYSNYFELGYEKEYDNFTLNAFGGFTLTNPLAEDTITGFLGESAFYGGGAGVINVGLRFSKEVKITEDFSLPLCVQLITNPRDKKVFFVFGMSF